LTGLVGDPQIFTILKLKGQKQIFEIINLAGCKIDTKTKIDFKNLINSNLVYLIETEKKDRIFFIWDYQYPDCTTWFEIFKISEKTLKSIYAESVLVTEIKRGKTNEYISLTVISDCNSNEKEINVKI